MAFSGYKEGRSSIYIANMDTGELTQVSSTGYENGPSWSPDGQRIVFSSTKENNKGIFRTDLLTGETMNLTSSPGNDILPVWSPDGRLIVFVSDRYGKPELFLMDSEGGEVQKLTRVGFTGLVAPAWSENGRELIFETIDNGDFDLFLADTATMEVRALTENSAEDIKGIFLR